MFNTGKISRVLLSISMVGMIAACNTPLMVGSAPSSTPPKIQIDPNDSKSRTWDNPRAFGPVPAELAAAGAAVCGSLDTQNAKHEAIGYHPSAMDINGEPFKGGGYFCVRK